MSKEADDEAIRKEAIRQLALKLAPGYKPNPTSSDEGAQLERTRESRRALTPQEQHIQYLADRIMRENEADEARKKAALERGDNTGRQTQQWQRSRDFDFER